MPAAASLSVAAGAASPAAPSEWRSPLGTPAAVLGLVLFSFGALAPMQDDSWWHLRCGQLIWQLGWVPQHDPFSFAIGAEAHWPNHEWLAQVLLHAVHEVGGLPLVNVGIGAIIALAGVLLFGAMRGSAAPRLVLLWLILPGLAAAFSVRPHVWTLLGLALVTWLIARGRWLWLPLVFVVWANLHGGVVLGGLVMVSACVAALVWRRAALPRILMVTSACGAATLFTPMGIEILTFPLTSVARLKQLQLMEWSAPGITSLLHIHFWLGLAAFVVVLWRARASMREWPTGGIAVAALLLGVMGMMSERNGPPFLMLMAVTLSRLLNPDEAPSNAASKAGLVQPPRPLPSGRMAAYAASALAGTLLLTLYTRPWGGLQWEPLSREAAAAVRACPQPTFNTYNTGGFLLWFTPEREVFIDSRQDPYPLDLLQATIAAQAGGSYQALFSRYGFRSAVMERGLPLGRALLRDGWRAIHLDERWLILTAPGLAENKGGPPTAFAAGGP